MTLTKLEKLVLSISGITALGIGTFILASPHAFYASYGITLGDDANLLSELRAPAAGLVAFGVLMLAGIWRVALVQTSIIMALTVFLAFPLGRIIGIAVDGMPTGAIIGALVIELIIAGLSLFAFRKRLSPTQNTASISHFNA